MARFTRQPQGQRLALSRRDFLRVAALGGSVSVLAACSSSNNNKNTATAVASRAASATVPSAPPASSSSPAAAAPAATTAGTATAAKAATAVKTGGQLVVAHSPFDSMSPILSFNDQAQWVQSQIYETLTAWNKQAQPVPLLAQSWTTSDDGLTWTFKLRQGVMWHDGNEIFAKGKSRPLTAQDVKYSFDTYMDPSVASAKASAFATVASVTAVDDSTVQIVTKTPDAFFLDVTKLSSAPIFPKEALDKYGKDGIGDHAVGSGPFMLKEYVPADHVTLVRNDAYRIKPNLDGMMWRIIPDVNVRLASLSAKESDVMMNVASKDVATFKSDKSYGLVYQQGPPGSGIGGLSYFAFNVNAAPFNDVRVRHAVGLAPDWNQMVADVLGENAQHVYGIVRDGAVGFNGDTLKPLFDGGQAQAKALLDAAGYPAGSDGMRAQGGQKLQATCLVINGSDGAKEGVILQAALKAIGFDLQIQSVEVTALLAAGRSGNYQIMAVGGGSFDNGLTTLVHTDGSFNLSHYSNPQVDQLLDQASATIDAGKRGPLWAKAEQVAMAEYPILPIARQFIIDVTRSVVHDYPPAFFNLGVVREDNNTWKE